MNEQASLWQSEQQSSDFAELCNALYERELSRLSEIDLPSIIAMQGKLKSLPHYVKRTAYMMMQADTPLTLDIQNASWSAKQASQLPLKNQDVAIIKKWYIGANIQLGLVVPILHQSIIVLDSIDRVDIEKQRFRTNAHGWFSMAYEEESPLVPRLLKPSKAIMTAACSGHSWLNGHKINPIIPSLRELLLSCAINWRNFKRPVAIY